MAEYCVKKLYHACSLAGPENSESYESIWAYFIKYQLSSSSIAGRFRIRITKMSAVDFIAMMGGNPENVPPDGFSIQGFVEKWTNNGWIHCLDWLGNPETPNLEIESDLLEMFKSFTTGIPTNNVCGFDPPISPEAEVMDDNKLILFPDLPKSDDSENRSDDDDYDLI